MSRIGNAVARRPRDESGRGAGEADKTTPPQPKEATVKAELPSGDDTATIPCPVCGQRFTPNGRRLYCGECRKIAWRRRRQPAAAPVAVPGPGRPRRPITVYECGSCGARSLGEQRCVDCRTFMSRVGIGGLCPSCLLPVAVADLVEVGLPSPAVAPPAPESPPRQPARARSEGRQR